MKKRALKNKALKQKRLVVLSLGGSIIMPGKVDVDFLSRFRRLILDRVRKHKERFIIVCGGGKVCREYIKAAKKLGCKSYYELDRLGIKVTNVNSELLRAIFGKYAYKDVVLDYNRKVKFSHILIGSGYLPGTSTDYDAVMLAITNNSKAVINLSNIKYVYTKDPRKYKSARRIKDISWDDFEKIVGGKFKSGMNLPFDPIASRKAQKKGINVAVLKGTDIKNLKNFLDGKKFSGTLIHS